MRPLILLFDIDGTLITTGGAGRRALERTFQARYGKADVFEGFAFGGMTDPAIIRAGLERIGRPYDLEEQQTLLDDYVERLGEELSRASVHKLHDGMREAVARAREQKHTAVGLGTGNIIAGAKMKLEPLAAYDWFEFGGFGCDHEHRARLIEKGIERGVALLKVPRAECRVVIIGDTPHDVTAAHANGAEAICVTTGSFDEAALKAAGADAIFPNLAAPNAIDRLLQHV